MLEAVDESYRIVK